MVRTAPTSPTGSSGGNASLKKGSRLSKQSKQAVMSAKKGGTLNAKQAVRLRKQLRKPGVSKAESKLVKKATSGGKSASTVTYASQAKRSGRRQAIKNSTIKSKKSY